MRYLGGGLKMILDEMINNLNISQKLSDIANRDGMSRDGRGVVYFCAKYFKKWINWRR